MRLSSYSTDDKLCLSKGAGIRCNDTGHLQKVLHGVMLVKRARDHCIELNLSTFSETCLATNIDRG